MKSKHPDVKSFDFAYATAQGAGSAWAAKGLSAKRNPANGSQSDLYVSMLWQHANIPSASVQDIALHIDGRPETVKGILKFLPKNFTIAAILKVDREAMDRFHATQDSQQAIGYFLGSTVMYGVANSGNVLSSADEQSPDYQVAMRVGGNSLDALVGKFVMGSAGPEFSVLAHGVRLDEVVPIIELPPHMHLV